MSLFSGKDKVAAANNDALKANYNWTIQNNARNYDYALSETQINAQNIAESIAFQNAERERAYQFEMQMRTHNARTQFAAWSKSEAIYKANNKLIDLGKKLAVESEHRWLEERFIETAFSNMDLIRSMQKTQFDSAILSAENLNVWNSKAGQAALANRNVLLTLDQAKGRAFLEMAGITLNFQKAYKDAEISRQQSQIAYQDALRTGQIQTESNRIGLEEKNADIAFKREDLYVQGLRASGVAASTGQVGRSAAKQVQSVVADIGRNQMVLAQAATTAYDQFKVAAKQINSNLMTAGQRFNLENKNTKNQLTYAAQVANQNKNVVNQNLGFQYQQGYQTQLEIFQGLQIANYDYQLGNAKIAGNLNYAQGEFLLGQQKLNASLDSAMKQTAINLRKVNIDTWQARINNKQNRMIKPEIPPAPPPPAPIPTPKIMMPLKPLDPPKPVYQSESTGFGGSPVGKILSGGLSIAGAVAGVTNPALGAGLAAGGRVLGSF